MLDLDSPAGARADRRLRSEQILWLTTVRADGQPQSSPVWFLWDGDTLLVFSQPDAQKLRNLAGNPRVAVHLELEGTADEGVTIDGTAAVDPDAPPSDQIEEYRVKYREGVKALGWTPARLARDFSVAIRIRPTRVRAWQRRVRLPLVALAAAVIVISALPVGQSASKPPQPPAPPAVERFDKITDCPALRLRYSQAHAIWKRSVRAGQEDQAGLAAMRGTLRRLEQLGDCLPRT